MYEFIEGERVELNPASVIIKAGGVGYFVHISVSTFSALQQSDKTFLYIHHIVREDAELLYGFADKDERELFRLLVSVSGVGANTARMMLSSLNTQEIQQHIVNSNVAALQKIKGIGAKTAQRIIVELKDKLSKGIIGKEEIYVPSNNTNQNEALSALVMLGFSKNDVSKVLSKILKDPQTQNLTVEGLVKLALKNM